MHPLYIQLVPQGYCLLSGAVPLKYHVSVGRDGPCICRVEHWQCFVYVGLQQGYENIPRHQSVGLPTSKFSRCSR